MHTLAINELLERFSTNPDTGISAAEAKKRFAEHGANELKEKPHPSFFKLLFNQFKNFLVIILLVAVVISLLLGEIIDAAAIISIIVLNAVLGVMQESRAENALAALKKMAAPNALVLRDGHRLILPAKELVPGDVVILEAGNFIPADVRLIESVNLKIEEASLTGESVPVNKNASLILEKDIPLGDRKNLAFMGTMVSYGRGRGVVTSTGMGTQIGRIAEMLQTDREELTPLQQKLNQLGKWLGILSLAVCGLIFIIGLIRDTDIGLVLGKGIALYIKTFEKQLVDLFMTAVSLAIAAVPEGLPAVVTICLALGMQHMVRRHALIRKLPAVETLGCATVICSDKTGTLTQNAMSVVEIFTGGKTITVTGEGYQPKGEFFTNDKAVDPALDSGLSLLLYASLLCNDARLEKTDGELFRMVGDPTEGALITVASKANIWKTDAEKRHTRIAEIPFDSDRKLMTTLHKLGNRDSAPAVTIGTPLAAFIKGAPDILLGLCDKIREGGTEKSLDRETRERILQSNSLMAGKALRVLGVAMLPLDKIPDQVEPATIEKNLTFLGLLGMIDPARPEVKAAIAIAKEAGIKTVMVTGDYKETAVAIAREIDLLSENGRVLAGAEIDAVDDEAFGAVAESVDTYARVSPEHKVKIVDALKKRGHVVAMTGDGVNDAPALRRADIGVAMGITGTDVTKETADVVLTDDNYASIVAAIEQGRIIYSNIRKLVLYLLACNVGEILIILLSIILGMPIPLSPIMLLWVNLVTDGAPAVALGMEKGDPDVMKRPPRPPREPVINREMLFSIVTYSIASVSAILVSYWLALQRFPGDLASARTVAFATLVCSEIIRAFVSRSEYNSVFTIGLFSNRAMLVATASSIFLLLLVLYVPFLQVVFNTRPLSWPDWLSMLPFIFIAPVISELSKIYLRGRLRRSRKS